jgi:hypothetical protein
MRNLVFALLVLAGVIVVLAPHILGAKGARLVAMISPYAPPPASDTRLLPVTYVTDFTLVFEQPTRASETGTDGGP